MSSPIDRRIHELTEWLREHHPEIAEEQKHLDTGTEPRAYWHYGYLMALKDVQQLPLRSS